MMTSAGCGEVEGERKKVAVRVVLKMPVNWSLTRLPRSKVSVWGDRKRER